MKLIIRVVDIKGRCPVYKLGNRITLREGYILEPGETDAVCMHSLASIFPYYVALAKGVKAGDLGLSRDGSEEAYVQCLDPCEITGGGTVRFEISRVDWSGREPQKSSKRPEIPVT
ncbi:MAG: TIGR04076 family protein [Syntrophobacteria bacterium]